MLKIIGCCVLLQTAVKVSDGEHIYEIDIKTTETACY